MALADVDIVNAKKGPPCAACLMVDRMTPEDRATLDEWMADPGITSRAILVALLDEGYDVPGEHTFARHRARKCWGRRNGAA